MSSAAPVRGCRDVRALPIAVDADTLINQACIIFNTSGIRVDTLIVMVIVSIMIILGITIVIKN